MQQAQTIKSAHYHWQGEAPLDAQVGMGLSKACRDCLLICIFDLDISMMIDPLRHRGSRLPTTTLGVVSEKFHTSTKYP